MTLPAFDENGLLPPGDYELTIYELIESVLVTGPAAADAWGREWRRKLVENLDAMVAQRVEVGVTEVFIDGSFVENKDVPNDIDGYFICDLVRWESGEIARRLAELDPIWTWDSTDRERLGRYAKPQLPMWHKYRVELFPDYGQYCGIFGPNGEPLTFAQAFRQSRTFQPKGIVKIGGIA